MPTKKDPAPAANGADGNPIAPAAEQAAAAKDPAAKIELLERALAEKDAELWEVTSQRDAAQDRARFLDDEVQALKRELKIADAPEKSWPSYRFRYGLDGKLEQRIFESQEELDQVNAEDDRDWYESPADIPTD